MADGGETDFGFLEVEFWELFIETLENWNSTDKSFA
jgi:hypothetical protein